MYLGVSRAAVVGDSDEGTSRSSSVLGGRGGGCGWTNGLGCMVNDFKFALLEKSSRISYGRYLRRLKARLSSRRFRRLPIPGGSSRS